MQGEKPSLAVSSSIIGVTRHPGAQWVSAFVMFRRPEVRRKKYIHIVDDHRMLNCADATC
jgi:hypothetical protein